MDRITAENDCSVPEGGTSCTGAERFQTGQNRMSQGSFCASLDPFLSLISFQRSVEGHCLASWTAFQPPDKAERMGNLHGSQRTGKQIPYPIQDLISGFGQIVRNMQSLQQDPNLAGNPSLGPSKGQAHVLCSISIPNFPPTARLSCTPQMSPSLCFPHGSGLHCQAPALQTQTGLPSESQPQLTDWKSLFSQ